MSMKNNKFLYIQIKDEIKKYIKDRNLKGDDLIPSELKLSQHFNASRVTIRMAINKLVEENILYKKRGSGTYVKKIDHSRLIGLTEEARIDNKKITNEILNLKVISPSDNIKEVLKLKENQSVYFIERLRKIAGKPVVLERSFMPMYLFTDLSIEVLKNSKYEYIELKKGYKIKRSSQKIIPVLPEKEIIEILDLKSEIPILKVESVGTLDEEVVFEYTIHFYNPLEYTYHITAER